MAKIKVAMIFVVLLVSLDASLVLSQVPWEIGTRDGSENEFVYTDLNYTVGDDFSSPGSPGVGFRYEIHNSTDDVQTGQWQEIKFKLTAEETGYDYYLLLVATTTRYPFEQPGSAWGAQATLDIKITNTKGQEQIGTNLTFQGASKQLVGVPGLLLTPGENQIYLQSGPYSQIAWDYLKFDRVSNIPDSNEREEIKKKVEDIKAKLNEKKKDNEDKQ